MPCIVPALLRLHTLASSTRVPGHPPTARRVCAVPGTSRSLTMGGIRSDWDSSTDTRVDQTSARSFSLRNPRKDLGKTSYLRSSLPLKEAIYLPS